MAEGNVNRKRQKNLRLSADKAEMLSQAKIVFGVSEADAIEISFMEWFIRKKVEYIQAFGKSAWDLALSRAKHNDGLKKPHATVAG